MTKVDIFGGIYKNDFPEYSLMWISEEERKISLKMYIDNDNIWVQIVLWGMILANICMLEEVFEDEMKIDSGLSVEM